MAPQKLRAFPTTTPIVSPKEYEGNNKVKLSGRILNVMTSLPTQIISDYNKETKQYFWDVEAVRGNSALYSSQHFLVEHSDWETHVIAWTGELINKNKNTSSLTAENLQDDPLYLDEDDKKILKKIM